MNNPVLYILGSIIIAVVSSSFTVWLSLRKFRAEKIWERKIEAYSKIVEALYGLKEHLRKGMDELYDERKMFEVANRQRIALSRQFDADLKKYRDIGALIISEHAVNLINKYHEELSTDEDEIEDRYDIDIKTTEKYLSALLKEAKKDLRG